MGLLDGKLADAIYKGFKGKLLSGSLRKVPDTDVLDAYGDPTPGTPVLSSCQGFVEDYSDFSRAQSGIPDTDLKVNIFAKSIDGITPEKDDTVLMNSVWYQIRKVSTDPATALWTCQSFVIPDPT